MKVSDFMKPERLDDRRKGLPRANHTYRYGRREVAKIAYRKEKRAARSK